MNKNHTMTKYGLLAVLAVVMVLCLSLSLALTSGNVYAEGETTEPVVAEVTLDALEDFDIGNIEIDDEVVASNVVKGLSEIGLAKITNDDGSLKTFAVVLPQTNGEGEDAPAIGQIAARAFEGKTTLVSINIPDVKIEKYIDDPRDPDSFSYGYATSYIIGEYAFKGCTALTSVRLPQPLSWLGENNKYENGEGGVFENCTSLTSINIPLTCNVIPADCFKGCSSLTEVTFESVKDQANQMNYIGVSAFAGTALTEFTVPDAQINVIDTNAFDTPTLKKIVFEKHCWGLEGLISENLVLDYLDLSNSYLNLGWGDTGTARIKFSDDSNVILPSLGSGTDPVKCLELLYKVSDADLLIIKDYNTKNTIQEVVSGDFDLTDSFLDAASKSGELSTALSNVSYNLVVNETTYVTFIVVDTIGREYSAQQLKLVGVSYKYVLKNVDGVGQMWVEDDEYTLPSEIQGITLDPEMWSDRLDGEPVLWTEMSAQVGSTFYQRISANIALPVDDTMVYSGAAYAISADIADAVEITGIVDSDGNTVENAVNAGTYTVTVALKNGDEDVAVKDYVWSDGSYDAKTFTLEITKKAAALNWTYGNEDITNKTSFEIDNSEDVRLGSFSATVVENNTITAVLEAVKDGTTDKLTGNAKLGEGIYVLTATHQNYQFSNATYVVRINANPLDLSDSGNLIWLANTSDATLNWSGGKVHIGTENGKVVVHTLPHTNIAYADIKTVVDSIVRSAGKAVTVTLKSNDAYTAVIGDDNEAQSACGMYTVTANLTAADNYKFTTNSASSLAARGVTVTVSPDGKTAVVTKTWYIVESENELLDNAGSIAATDWVAFTIKGWTYGQDVTVNVPRLAHGDEAPDWLSNNEIDAKIEFTLTLHSTSGDKVFTFTRKDFAKYINASMPAGSYTLDVTVGAITIDGNHTHWWNGEDHVGSGEDYEASGFTGKYEFTVAAANIVVSSDKLPVGDNGYADYEWKLNSNRELFFKEFADKVNAEGALTLTEVTRTGYWADKEADEYFKDYTVTYNFARQYDEKYNESNNNDILQLIAGGANGTYTVYFQITAPNHNNLTDTHVDGRYNYYFTVTVYEEIATPTINANGLVYTGSKLLPDIAESGLYETVWNATDLYVRAGQHSVSFKLYDSVHYRWADKAVTGDTVTVVYTVAKADNAWVRVPNIVNWNYESFDTQVNRIRAVTKYLDNGQSIKFAITKADGTSIDGLTEFTVKEDGTLNDSALIAALNALKSGTYKLNVTVAGTNNYNELTETVEFVVGKAINTWADGEKDLVLPSWIVGKFDLDENVMVVNAAHGKVNIQIRDLDGVVYYDSNEPEVNTLNNLEVGKYLLVAWVDATDDYSALTERTFTIEVLEKIGLPWWGTTLVTVGALGLAAAIILILWKLKVFEILTDKISLAITTRATIDATIAAIRATKTAEEAEAHKRKVEARERLENAREAYRNKTPEERAQALQERAEATATKADEMHAKAGKMRERADKMSGKTQQTEQPEQDEQTVEDVQATDDTPTEE